MDTHFWKISWDHLNYCDTLTYSICTNSVSKKEEALYILKATKNRDCITFTELCIPNRWINPSLKHIQGKSSCLNVRSCIEVPILPQWVQDYVHEVKGRTQPWTCTLAWHTKESVETQKICTYKKTFKIANVHYIWWRILDTHLFIRLMSSVWKNLTWNIQLLLFNLIVKNTLCYYYCKKAGNFMSWYAGDRNWLGLTTLVCELRFFLWLQSTSTTQQYIFFN